MQIHRHFIAWLVAGLTVLCVAGVVAWAAFAPALAELEALAADFAAKKPPLSSVVLDRNGRRIGEFADEKRYWTALEAMPDHLVQAFLSAEDRAFYDHAGVDLGAIFRAAWVNLRRGRVAQGGSTITQQLARMVYLSNEKTFERKWKEMVLAVFLESQYPKAELLEYYLNYIYLGNHSYGVEAAARNYFRKAVDELNPAESAILAGLPQAPSRYALNHHFDAAKKRQRYVLDRMVDDGALSADEADYWYQYPLEVAKKPEPTNRQAGYFIDQVRSELGRMFELSELDSQGLVIETTLDLDLQTSSRNALGDTLARLVATDGNARDEAQGAAVVIDPATGAILALQGGRDFAESQFNRVASTKRSIGALFLPLLYGLALENGYALSSSLYAEPGSTRRGRPRGTDLTLYEGLLGSRLYESARILANLGLGTVAGFCERLGLVFPNADMSLVIGQGRASLLEIARAYSGFAAGGRVQTPYLVAKVTDGEGRVIYSRAAAAGVRVMSHSTAYIINSVLRDLGSTFDADKAEIATAFGAGVGLHDGWAVGYNGGFLAAIWLGAETGRWRLGSDMQAIHGLMAEVWRDYQSRPEVRAALSAGQRTSRIPTGIRYYPTTLGSRPGQTAMLPHKAGSAPRPL